MDWTGYATDITLNTELMNGQNDFNVIYEDDYVVDKMIVGNNIGQLTQTIGENKLNKYYRLIYLFLSNGLYLIPDSFEWIKNKINADDLIVKIVNDITFIDNITIIPLIHIDKEINIVEYIDMINYLNMNDTDNILLYFDDFDGNRLEFALNFMNKKNIVTNYNNQDNNSYDVWFCNHFDFVDPRNCNWMYHRLPYYINQLIYISKSCKNLAKICITLDYRFFNLKNNIYLEFINLLSCFMKLKLYNGQYMTFYKCILVGCDLDLYKLQKWCEKYLIKEIEINNDMFEEKNETCVNKYKIITSLNLNIINNIYKPIEDTRRKFNTYLYKRYKMTFKYDSFDTINNLRYIKYIIKKSIIDAYNYIKNYPITINPYYLDNPKKVIFTYSEINKVYFPNILNANFYKLKLSPSGLYSITYPKEVNLISNIIFENTKYKKILDATANCGGNTIGFAQKFKKVISIELEKHNFKCLKNNVRQYYFTNVKVYNRDCLEYLKNTNYKYKLIFFDPPWGGSLISTKTNVDISLSGISMDSIISMILEKNNKTQIFIKVPNNYYTKLKHTKFNIKNYKLLMFSKQ